MSKKEHLPHLELHLNLLVLKSFPRKRGYTAFIWEKFRAGIEAGGKVMEEIDLCSLNINYCTGCFRCIFDTPGRCFMDDDMAPLIQKSLAADLILCVTPLYFYAMNARLKTFWERMYPIFQMKMVRGSNGELVNKTRHSRQWQQKVLAAVVVGSLPEEGDNYQPVVDSFRQIAHGLDMRWGGALVRPESTKLLFPFSRPVRYAAIFNAVEKAGRELAQEGFMDNETLAQASLPLARSKEKFVEYSEKYLTAGRSLGGTVDIHAVSKMLMEQPEAICTIMQDNFNGAAAGALVADICLTFTDKEARYRLTISNRSLNFEPIVERGEHDLVIETTLPTWAAVFRHDIDVRAAVMDGRIVVSGDKRLLLRFETLFAPPGD